MSLTRAQWIEMWNEVRQIRMNCYTIQSQRRTDSTVFKSTEAILDETDKIREKIQGVIGQME